MEGVLVGCAQITWPGDAPRERVLAEVAQAGYDGVPAGPAAGTADEVAGLYDRHGLRCAPGYFGGDFWDPAQRAELLAQAQAYARFMREVGCGEVFVAAGFDWVTRGGQTRTQLAGHVGPDDGLSDAQYRQFAETLNRVGEITLAEGVRSCFHNHVGSVIETRAEIDRLFALVDRDLVFLGPDTGHLAWGGADVVQFYRDYAASIKTMHLKDIDPCVLREGHAQSCGYATFSNRGIFVELGEGMVDFPALLEILGGVGFRGWVVAETDVTQKATPLESALASRRYLQSLGV